MNIYLKLDKKPESIKELLTKLFSSFHPSEVKNIETYIDKECTLIQCKSHKYRSFDDIEDIVNTYFPETHPKEIIYELLLLDLVNPEYKNTKYYFFFLTCGDIERITMLYTSYKQSKDSFAIYYDNKSGSKYSWKELLDLVDIKCVDDMYNYKERIKNG